MKLYGVDFTSSPSKQKPIYVAEGEVELSGSSQVLSCQKVQQFRTLESFETWLQLVSKEEGILGIDAPLSMPRIFLQFMFPDPFLKFGIDKVGETWEGPEAWESLAKLVATIGDTKFTSEIDRYREAQPKGRKHPKRATDGLAQAITPLMLHGVPVAKMFLKAMPILHRSPIDVLPFRNESQKFKAFEIYPALIARRLGEYLGQRVRYKSGELATAQNGRERLFDALYRNESGVMKINRLSQDLYEDAVDDANGDILDSIFALILVAEASLTPNFGIPDGVDRMEGWIVGSQYFTDAPSELFPNDESSDL